MLTSAGNLDVCIAKFDAAGNHVWSQLYGDATYQPGRRVSMDSGGNVIATGEFFGTIDFGGGTLTSAGGNDIWVAKFDGTGTHLWSLNFGDSDDQYARGLAVDSSDNILLTGYHEGTVDFGGGPLTSADLNDLYVAKFDLAGNHIWSQDFPGTDQQYTISCAVDRRDNLIVGVYYLGDIDFGAGPVWYQSYNTAIARFDPAGALISAQHFLGGGGTAFCNGTATDTRGNVLIAGNFGTYADFGGSPLIGAGSVDAFCAKFWARPEIHGALDVPADQGGFINLEWDARRGLTRRAGHYRVQPCGAPCPPPPMPPWSSRAPWCRINRPRI